MKKGTRVFFNKKFKCQLMNFQKLALDLYQLFLLFIVQNSNTLSVIAKETNVQLPERAQESGCLQGSLIVPNACKDLNEGTCPIRQGTSYSLEFEMEFPVLPKNEPLCGMEISVELIGDKGLPLGNFFFAIAVENRQINRYKWIHNLTTVQKRKK